MRKILISLVLLTLFVLFGGPAIADDDAANPGDQSSSETNQGNSDEPSESSDDPSPSARSGEDAGSEDADAPAADSESGPAADEPAQEPTADPVDEDEPATEPQATPGDPAAGESPEAKDSDSEASRDPSSDAGSDDAAPEPKLKDASVPTAGSVVICHAAADSNTFSEESVSADAAADGHDADTRDVIPPFDYADGLYEGKNYDDVGKALLEAHCDPAAVPVVPADLAEQQLARTLVALAAVAPNVTICHATTSSTNPYDVISPAAEGAVDGHANHTGPVFQPGATSWGDIIPPFNDINHISFAGLNWTAEGQAIYNNGCVPPASAPAVAVVPDRVTICHRTGDHFVTLSVIANGTAEGHTAHFRDIIPPFTFGNITFGGLNWDDDAADFLHDGCRHHHHRHHHKGHHHHRRGGALPNTGGPALSALLLAFMLVAAGATLVTNHRPGMNGRLAMTAGLPEPVTWSTHPSPPLAVDETDSLAHVRRRRAVTAIALAFAAATIAIRRSLR